MDIKEYELMMKFNLTNDERVFISDKIDNLIESFKMLETIDTSGVEPLVTVLDIQNVLREDVMTKFITCEELLSNAPEQYDGYFQVPKTLEV